MKKKLIILFGFIFLLTGCNKEEIKPEESKIKKIAELNVLEVYNKNVAKLEKKKGDGLWNQLTEADRKMWVEYTAKTKISFDAEKINIDIDKDTIEITIPKAKIGKIVIDESSFTKDSFKFSNDNFFNKNEITPEDEKKAIEKANEDMKKSIEKNEQVFEMAKNKFKKIVGKYIETISEKSGKKYKLIWKELE